MATLHITNGDSAIPVIRAAGVGGEILPWRDVLHEGPVRAELSLEELSALRLAFLFDAYGADRERAEREFAERDALLAGAPARPEVVLWFEHDLYDQLDRKSTRLNSSHLVISYAVFCLNKKKRQLSC